EVFFARAVDMASESAPAFDFPESEAMAIAAAAAGGIGRQVRLSAMVSEGKCHRGRGVGVEIALSEDLVCAGGENRSGRDAVLHGIGALVGQVPAPDVHGFLVGIEKLDGIRSGR